MCLTNKDQWSPDMVPYQTTDKQRTAERAMEQEHVRGPSSSVGSVLGSPSCLMQHRGFDPPLRRMFLVEGDFSLGVNMGFDSIP